MRVNPIKSKSGGILLPNLFQLAYVTTDMDKAQQVLGAQFGITKWQNPPTFETKPGSTIRFANAYVGDIMVQLFQVLSGEDGSIWHNWQPEPGQLMRFHHIGHMLFDDEEWQHVLKEIDRLKFPVVMRGNHKNFEDFVYIDARETLGHYVEYIYCKPEGQVFFDELRKSE
jgi:hypothetical protein